MGVRLVSDKSDGEGGVGDAKAEGHSVFSIAPQLRYAFPLLLLLIRSSSYTKPSQSLP